MTQNSNSPPEKIKPSFSGHETFPFRYTWLKKGVDAVRDDPSVFTSDRATITLGVGKNMVRSSRHWCNEFRKERFVSDLIDWAEINSTRRSSD